MIPKPLDEITSADLDRLEEEKEPESRTLEYKRELPEKWKTLKSLCSFANTGTGDLLIGIDEDGQHYAKDIVGIPAEKIEVAKSKIEQWARSGIEPALVNFQIQPVPIAQGYVLVVRIWRSWVGPHRVKESGLFYGRHSEGSYKLSMEELRRAFTEFDGLLERMKILREKRVGVDLLNYPPVPMEHGPKLVLHLISLGAIGGHSEIDLHLAHDYLHNGITALDWSVDHWEYNFEGVLASCMTELSHFHHAYIQVYRSGIIEVCAQLSVGENQSMEPPEKRVLSSIDGYLDLLRKLQVPPPIFCLLSLVDIGGLKLGVWDKGGYPIETTPLTSSMLLLPAMELQTLDKNAPMGLKRAFDQLWNAYGHDKSPLIDDEGHYHRQ